MDSKIAPLPAESYGGDDFRENLHEMKWALRQLVSDAQDMRVHAEILKQPARRRQLEHFAQGVDLLQRNWAQLERDLVDKN